MLTFADIALETTIVYILVWGILFPAFVTAGGNPNFEPCRENLERLHAAGLEVVELPWLPYVEGEEPAVVVPYTNFYVCNGGVIVPTRGEETDPDALALLASLFPGREAVAVPGETLALGGGGVHCITQQVPAVDEI